MKVTEDKILAVFRLQVSGKEACITITRVSKCYKVTRVIDKDVYTQYYARMSQAYDVMLKMIEDLK